jgi:hypothetical protein
MEGGGGQTTPTDSRSKRIRASRRGGQLLTRARSPSNKTGLPDRVCSRMPLSRTVAPYSPAQTWKTSRRSGVTGGISPLHTGYQLLRTTGQPHVRDRAAALDHHTRAAIQQLNGVLPWTGHDDQASPLPRTASSKRGLRPTQPGSGPPPLVRFPYDFLPCSWAPLTAGASRARSRSRSS